MRDLSERRERIEFAKKLAIKVGEMSSRSLYQSFAQEEAVLRAQQREADESNSNCEEN